MKKTGHRAKTLIIEGLGKYQCEPKSPYYKSREQYLSRALIGLSGARVIEWETEELEPNSKKWANTPDIKGCR